MRIRFLRDYRGTRTKEVFYTAGQEAEFPGGMARLMIAEGVAESAMPPRVVAPVTPEAPEQEAGDGRRHRASRR